MPQILRLIFFTFITLMVFSLPAYPQIEMTSFSATSRGGVSTPLATDYQAQGINPANLALKPTFEGFNNTLGLGELGLSVYSDALSKINLNQALFDPNKKFTPSEKAEAARDFTSKGVSFNMDFLYGGFAHQRKDGGAGFCFTMRERAQWYSRFSEKAAQILFNGFNAQFQVGELVRPYFDSLLTKVVFNPVTNSIEIDTLGAIATLPQTLTQILNGTRISMAWSREYGVSYGMTVIDNFDFKLNAGIGARYIQGIANMDIESDGKSLKAFISASPWFGIKFGQNGQLQSASDSVNSGFLPKPAGDGFGLDLGLTAVFKDKFRISAAITDFGSVNYKTNVFTASDTFLTSLTTRGFTNYDFFLNAQQFDGFQKDLIKWDGLKNRAQFLPTKFRFGAAVVKKNMQAGVDLVVPLNDRAGNFQKPFVSLGGEVRILGFLQLGSGIMFGGNYTSTLIPFGITLVTGGGFWEMGIASRDISTFLKKSNPMLSLTTGMLRFRF
jgi:hypothetical protein